MRWKVPKFGGFARMVNPFYTLPTNVARKLGLQETVFPSQKIDPDEQNWISLNKGPQRDLNPYTQDYSNNLAYYAWLTNPLAAKIVETHQDFMIGDGMKADSEDDRLQEVLDAFWMDDINDFDMQQHAIAGELFIFGELLSIPFVNEFNGLTRYARFDPVLIKEVQPHPLFPQVANTVILKPQANVLRDGVPIEKLQIIGRDRDPRSPSAGQLVGDCVYFAVNKLSSKRRGHSQFFRTSDYMDIFDKRMFAEAERQEMLKNWCWDVELKGANDNQIKEYLNKVSAPSPGSILAHSDAAKWQLITPDTKAGDFAESNRQFLRLILGTYGIPEHWMSLGSDVNFATAKAMAQPTLRAMKRHQFYMVKYFHALIDYQIEQSIKYGTLPRGEYDYTIMVDEIETTDMATVGAFMVNIANTLIAAESQGWVTKDAAAESFSKHYAQTGVEIEPSDAEAEPTEDENRVVEMFKKMRKAGDVLANSGKPKKRRRGVYRRSATY